MCYHYAKVPFNLGVLQCVSLCRVGLLHGQLWAVYLDLTYICLDGTTCATLLSSKPEHPGLSALTPNRCCLKIRDFWSGLQIHLVRSAKLAVCKLGTAKFNDKKTSLKLQIIDW